MFVYAFLNGIMLLTHRLNNSVHIYRQTYGVNFVIPLGMLG
jgi:hypothetical protein